MIGLLLRPDQEPEVVEAELWTESAVLDRLAGPPSPYWFTFKAPGHQGGTMSVVYGLAASGPINRYASALLAGLLTEETPVRGPALVVRGVDRTSSYSLSERDVLALGAQLVASEHPIPGRGRLTSRRGRHRAGKPAPTRGEPC